MLVEGLHRLEYRGYDSAGLAVVYRGRTADHQDGRPGPGPEGQARREAGQGDDQHRPHALGHPRRAERHQRPPAHRRAAPRRPGAQRHHRECRSAPRDQLTADGEECHGDRDRVPRAHGRHGARRATTGQHSKRRSPRAHPARKVEGTYGLVDARHEEPRRALVVASQRRPHRPWPRRDGDVRRLRASRRWSGTPARSSTWRTARSRPLRRPTTTRRRSPVAAPRITLSRRRPRWTPTPTVTLRAGAPSATTCARRSMSSPTPSGARSWAWPRRAVRHREARRPQPRRPRAAEHQAR